MRAIPYGTRGSYSVPSDEGFSTIKYGGSTTCWAIENQNKKTGKVERVIIDAGNGIVKLGRDIMRNIANEDLSSICILFTHLHPDHCTEFPFFAPNYVPAAAINLFGMESLNQHVGKVLERNMLPPQFPIEYKDLKSKRKHIILKDGAMIGEPYLTTMTVQVMQAYAPSHPQQGALYYRITDRESGASVVCAWDLESKVGGDKALIKFAKNADLLIHDAQYTDAEYNSDKFIVQGYGHSTYEMALDNAKQAEVKRLVCTHFNPAHDDAKLDMIAEMLSEKGSALGITATLAQQGKSIEV